MLLSLPFTFILTFKSISIGTHLDSHFNKSYSTIPYPNKGLKLNIWVVTHSYIWIRQVLGPQAKSEMKLKIKSELKAKLKLRTLTIL